MMIYFVFILYIFLNAMQVITSIACVVIHIWAESKLVGGTNETMSEPNHI